MVLTQSPRRLLCVAEEDMGEATEMQPTPPSGKTKKFSIRLGKLPRVAA